MTKMKIKKMTKSTIAVIIMGVVLACVLAFGGTYAYFTGKSRAESGKFTTGHVFLTSNGAVKTLNKTNVMPGEQILDAEAIKVNVDTSEEGNYVAVKFIITVKDSGGNEVSAANQTAWGVEVGGIEATTGTGWYKYGSEANVYIWGTAGSADGAVAAKGDLVVNSNAFVFRANDEAVQADDAEAVTVSNNKLMNAEVTITMQAYSIQSTLDAGNAAITKATLITELIGKFA